MNTPAIQAKVDTWNQLSQYVDSNDGVAVITMYELRKIAHAGRLGSTVRAMIREKLNSLGLDIIRDETSQHPDGNSGLVQDRQPRWIHDQGSKGGSAGYQHV